jgi:hypothetical protein
VQTDFTGIKLKREARGRLSSCIHPAVMIKKLRVEYCQDSEKKKFNGYNILSLENKQAEDIEDDEDNEKFLQTLANAKR